MDVPIGGVLDACFDQDSVGCPRIELLLEVARYPSAKERGRIAENDWSGIESANHGASGRLFRIDQPRRDGMGELADLAAGLDVAPARRRRHGGYAHGLDDLAGPQRGFERSGDKRLDAEIARPRSTAQRDLCTQRRKRGYPVRSGISMTERSPDRATVADRPVGNGAGNPLHGAARYVGYSAILDVAMRDTGADDEFIAAAFGPFQFGKPGYVDDQIRLDQPQIEHRPQRLPAGNDLGRAVRPGHQGKRGLHVGWTIVGERCRLHAADLSASRAASTASTMRRGEIGECRSSTPSGRSASFTALAMAAGGAIAPPSPMPLTPNIV